MATSTHSTENRYNTGVVLDPISLIHRGDDAFISFHSKRGDDFKDLFSCETSRVDRNLLQSLNEPTTSYYFSINSFFRANKGSNRNFPQAYPAYRDSKGLRYLNACYTDIDCYKANKTPEETYYQLTKLQDKREIPPISLIIMSGRGVWCLWLLKSQEDYSKPQKASDSALKIYTKIQVAIQNKLASLGADSQATDAARITRLAGSLNASNGASVNFWKQLDDGSKEYFYTLSELVEFYKIPVPKWRARANCKPIDEATRATKRNGRKAVYENRLRQIERLEKMRGGFKEGCRHHAILLYANFLFFNKTPLEKVYDRVRKWHDHATPR